MMRDVGEENMQERINGDVNLCGRNVVSELSGGSSYYHLKCSTASICNQSTGMDNW